MSKRLFILVPALIFAVGCVGDSGSGGAAQEGEAVETGAPSMSESAGPPEVAGDTISTDSGLRYIVIQSGDGPQAEPGQVVSVHYTGWFTDGRKFDSSFDRNEPFSFPLGAGQVIAGWDEALAMMKVGDKWRLVLPPQLAYGERGHPAGIPPNSTLLFDVELVGVE
jgi:FKBP-type peptidyl-prolyl cis-trans isomerase